MENRLQKWWSLFGKYWIVKNEHNDDDMKFMRWLMTSTNHGMVDTCGENISNVTNLPQGSGHLSQKGGLCNHSKHLKMELGQQLLIKSPFKMKRDIVKRAEDFVSASSIVWNDNNSCCWFNRKLDIVKEYRDCGPIELSLPNSRIGFFDECMTQKFFWSRSVFK